MNLLDKIPLSMLVVAAVLLGLAPFIPEPHLWQKLKMLFISTLVKPVDIFDLVMHDTPAVLVVIKLIPRRK